MPVYQNLVKQKRRHINMDTIDPSVHVLLTVWFILRRNINLLNIS